MNKRVYKICILSLMLTLALMLSYIEMLLPVNLGIPGIKLGLANMLTIFILFTLGKKDAILITLLRILIIGLLFTGINMMLYSLSGAFLSLVIMLILYDIHLFHMPFISVTGAIFHNVGQIICACFIFQTSAILYYLPVLVIAGCITGLVVGMLTVFIYNRIGNWVRNKIYE